MKSVDISLHNYIFPNIYEDGWKFVAVGAFVSLIASLIWIPLGGLLLLATVLCFYSFRDPVRVTPVLSSAVVAPADGYIVSINREKGPDALGLQNKNFTKICIYSSLFDVHFNRIPIKGRVNKVFYDSGKKYTGSFDKNNISNEKMLFSLRGSESVDFVLQQTAVLCNKRIITKIKTGDEFKAGNKFGFIRFGGYTDLFLPDKVQPLVCVGQKIIAGETIMADINSDAPRMEGEVR